MRNLFKSNLVVSLAIIAQLLVACNGGEMSGGVNSKARKPGGPNGSDGNPNDPNGGGDDGGLKPEDGDKAFLTKPKFALMARDLRCGLCHMRINGDVVSADNVMSFEPDRSLPAPGNEDHIVSMWRGLTLTGEYDEVINGTWYIKGTFPNDRSKSKMKFKVTGGLKENYTGVEIPPKGFPTLDLAVAESVAKGTLEAKGFKITGVHSGNAVIDGSGSPIVINGEVLVKGDVVIAGTYKGRGTIYATGNIYIAGNIAPTVSAFPFPADKKMAMQQGRDKAENQDTDALALAAKSSIILGNPNAPSVKQTPHKVNPPVADDNVLKWFPGGAGAYLALANKNFGVQVKTKIEAFLYAEHMIAGMIGSYEINGGVMCDSFHILGTRGKFTPNTNALNFDYRFAGGLAVLEALNGGFAPQ